MAYGSDQIQNPAAWGGIDPNRGYVPAWDNWQPQASPLTHERLRQFHDPDLSISYEQTMPNKDFIDAMRQDVWDSERYKRKTFGHLYAQDLRDTLRSGRSYQGGIPILSGTDNPWSMSGSGDAVYDDLRATTGAYGKPGGNQSNIDQYWARVKKAYPQVRGGSEQGTMQDWQAPNPNFWQQDRQNLANEAQFARLWEQSYPSLYMDASQRVRSALPGTTMDVTSLPEPPRWTTPEEFRQWKALNPQDIEGPPTASRSNPQQSARTGYLTAPAGIPTIGGRPTGDAFRVPLTTRLRDLAETSNRVTTPYETWAKLLPLLYKIESWRRANTR